MFAWKSRRLNRPGQLPDERMNGTRQRPGQAAGDPDAGWDALSGTEPRHPGTEGDDRHGNRQRGLPDGQTEQQPKVADHSMYA